MAKRDYGNPPQVFSEGTQTDPTTTDVLADTDKQSAGLYEVRVFVGGAVDATYAVQRRNAANDANVGDAIVLRGGTTTAEYVLTLTLETDERVRVLPSANVTGDVEAAIQIERLS